MKAVITADVINSTEFPSDKVNAVLRETLKNLGKEKKNWEIYRGDEFQIRTQNPEQAFEQIIYIKANLIENGLDARFSIGIGEESFEAASIKESNGEAYIFSGKTLDVLKENKLQSVMLKSGDKNFDATFNLIFQYLEVVMQGWTPTSTRFVLRQMAMKDKTQNEIAASLSVSQSAYSRGLKRANYELIMATDHYFRAQIASLKK